MENGIEKGVENMMENRLKIQVEREIPLNDRRILNDTFGWRIERVYFHSDSPEIAECLE